MNELKSRFVAMVSHEYRTPLTLIRNTGYILQKLFEKRDQKAFVNRIDKLNWTIDSMITLLEETLTIEKIESGGIKIKNQEVDLKQIISDKINEFDEIKKPGQYIHLILDETIDHTLFTDIDIITHCISNLTNNAIKYSPENSPIIIELNKFHNGFQIKVQDNGIGIPEEDQKHIFTPFHRSNNTVGIHGTGLGLSITKQFIEAIGGDIHFESKESIGTTFTINIYHQNEPVVA